VELASCLCLDRLLPSRDVNIEKWARMFGKLGNKRSVYEEFVDKHLNQTFFFITLHNFTSQKIYCVARDREAWRLIVMEAKAHPGL
jgi:hypothetical protein